MKFYTQNITLIEKNQIDVTPVLVNGNDVIGNLNEYTVSSRFTDTINGKIKNGTLVLKCIDVCF